MLELPPDESGKGVEIELVETGIDAPQEEAGFARLDLKDDIHEEEDTAAGKGNGEDAAGDNDNIGGGSNNNNGRNINNAENGEAHLLEENVEERRAREQLRRSRLILLVCVLCYGVGLFLVSVPSKLDTQESVEEGGRGQPVEVPGFVSSSVTISLGRSLGTFVIIFFTTRRQGIRHGFKAGIGDGPYLQKANILGFFAPMVSSVGYITYDLLLRQGGDISVYSAATSLHTAIPAIWGFVVLREKLSWKKGLGLVLAFVSVFLLSTSAPDSDSSSSNNTTTGGTLPGLSITGTTDLLLVGTILLWGTSLISRSAAARMRPWLNALMTFFYGQLSFFFISFFVFVGIGGPIALQHLFTPWTAFIVGGHIVISFGAVSYTNLTSGKNTATWGALTQLNVVVTILLSIIVFREDVTLLQCLGFTLMVASMLLIALK